MQFARENSLVNVNCKIRKRAYTECILEYQYWNRNDQEHAPPPHRSQEKVTRKKTGDQKADSGSNAAALRRNLYHQVRQADHVCAFFKDWCSRQFQYDVCHLS